MYMNINPKKSPDFQHEVFRFLELTVYQEDKNRCKLTSNSHNFT